MPNVTAQTRLDENGQSHTYFVDTVGTTSTTYTYPTPQDELIIENQGQSNLIVSISGGAYTVPPHTIQRIDSVFASFDIVAASGLQTFDATVIANDPTIKNRALSEISNQTGTRFIKALRNTLKSGINSCAIQIQGDSTANGNNEWFYLAMQELAKKYPKYTFLHALWDDILQCYESSTVMQTGSDGEGYVTITTGSPSTPDSAILGITGDIDIRMKVALDNWIPSGEGILASKFGSAGSRSWALGLNASKQLYWWWSADGTALLGGDAVGYRSSVGLTVNNGDAIHVRATMDVDNGAAGKTMKFYTSADGITWTQLGTDIISAGITSIFVSTAPLVINGRGSVQWTGKVYRAELRNGIDGTVVASPNFAMAPVSTIDINAGNALYDKQSNKWSMASGASFRNGSPAVLLLNASTSGKALSYSSDSTRFAKQTPIDPMLAFISYSHNEGGAMDYPTAYPSFIDQILTKYPNVGVVCVTQNPKKSPNVTDDILRHQSRCNLISRIAARKDVGLVDAYTAFLDTGNPDFYVSSDGTHPTQAGFNMWRDEALKFLKIALL